MDIKIVNCLSNVQEMKEKIVEAERLEVEVEKEENRFNNFLKNQLKNLKNDVAFLHENIIATFPYVKVENDEDVEAMKGIIEFLKNAKYCTLTEHKKTEITKALFGLGKGKHAKELQEYSDSLSKDDEQYLSSVTDSADIVISSLHNAFHSGESNPVIDRVFGQYYNLRSFIANNQEENDYGKALMKKIVADPEISKEHKAMVKKAYQEYKVECKYHGLNLGGRVAAGTAGVLVVPVVVAAIAEGIASGIIKLTGEVFNIATNFLAIPFDSLAMKIREKSDSAAAKVGSVIVDIPGLLLKGVGIVTEGILKVGATLVDTAFTIATLPVNLAMAGILKLGRVSINDRIKDTDKKIEKNIAGILSENGSKIKHKNVAIDGIEVGDDEKMVVYGKYMEGDLLRGYQLTFNVGKDVLEAVQKTQEEQMKITETLMAANVIDQFTDETVPADQIKELNETRLELVYKEALIISNITTQKPVERKFDITPELEDGIIDQFGFDNFDENTDSNSEINE